MERYPCRDMNDVRSNYSAIKVVTDLYDKWKLPLPNDLLVEFKRGIRDYFKRESEKPERRVIHYDGDGCIELLQLPEEVKILEIAKAWFDANELLVYEPSPYDYYTGQKFTGGTKFVKRNGRWWVYHTIWLDV